MYAKSDKSVLNVTLMSKRNLEENDKNGVNCLNDDWIQNSFSDNTKRVKTDNRWTPTQPNILIESEPSNSGVNQMNGSQENSNMEDEDNSLDDGMDEFYSQAVDLMTQQMSGNSSNRSGNTLQSTEHISDQNMTTQTTTTTIPKSDEDVVMNTIGSNHSSNTSSEATEGRLKILESRYQKTTEEVLRLKTENILMKNKIQIIERERERERESHKNDGNYESTIKFERNERTTQQVLMENLMVIVRQFAPNAPILKTTLEYLRQRKRMDSEMNFSQIKIPEFFGPLTLSPGLGSISSTSTQNTPLNTGDILVPESQNSIIGGKRAKYSSSSIPSQISETQPSNDSPLNSLPQPMDTYSGPSNESTIRETVVSQTNSQNQTQRSKIIWNSIRTVLEHKFQTDVQQLNQLYFESQKQFDDNWIRDNQEISDWTTSLNKLTTDLGIYIEPIDNF